MYIAAALFPSLRLSRRCAKVVREREREERIILQNVWRDAFDVFVLRKESAFFCFFRRPIFSSFCSEHQRTTPKKKGQRTRLVRKKNASRKKKKKEKKTTTTTKKKIRERQKKERELFEYISINALFFCVCAFAFAFLSSRNNASGSFVGFSASSDDDEKTVQKLLRSFRRRRRNDRGRL